MLSTSSPRPRGRRSARSSWSSRAASGSRPSGACRQPFVMPWKTPDRSPAGRGQPGRWQPGRRICGGGTAVPPDNEGRTGRERDRLGHRDGPPGKSHRAGRDGARLADPAAQPAHGRDGPPGGGSGRGFDRQRGPDRPSRALRGALPDPVRAIARRPARRDARWPRGRREPGGGPRCSARTAKLLSGCIVQDIAEIDDVALAERRATVMRAGRVHVREPGRRPDGTTFPQEVELTRIDVGGEARLLVLIRDLAESSASSRAAPGAEDGGDRPARRGRRARAQQPAGGDRRVQPAHPARRPTARRHASRRRPADPGGRPDAAHRPEPARLRAPAAARARTRRRSERSSRASSSLQSYSHRARRRSRSTSTCRPTCRRSMDRSGQMQQVLLNLTLNAIQAIRSNQVERHDRDHRAPRRWPGRRRAVRPVLDHRRRARRRPEHRSRLFVPFFTTKRAR